MGSYLLPSPQEMAAYDRKTIASGVPGIELMERAGQGIAGIILDSYRVETKAAGHVLVLCGAGNNGGDGAVVARELIRHKVRSYTVIAYSDKRSADLVTQLERLQAVGGEILEYGNLGSSNTSGKFKQINDELLKELISNSVIIVDGLLGTGQKDAPRGVVAQMIELLNLDRKVPVVAIDIPSGANGDTGEVYEPHVHAHSTVTIECIKRGMLQYPARRACGEIFCTGIGLNLEDPSEFSLISKDNLPYLPIREGEAHKGDAGRVAILGGSNEMPGAPVLAALGALKCGAGLVYATVGSNAAARNRPLEVIDLTTKVTDQGYFDSESFVQIEQKINLCNALVCGPGLGSSLAIAGFLSSALKFIVARKVPTVFDADALNCFAQGGVRPTGLDWCIFTPHPGEAARLLGCSVAEIQRDRYLAAQSLHNRFKATIVLKGAGTVIYSQNRGYVCSTGNPWMATGGTGDVLSGVIATFLAQGLKPKDAATLGVYLHNAAGDRVHSRTGGPLTASELAESIPEVYGGAT